MHGFGIRRRRGSTAMEFALWLPIAVLLLSGLVDLSWFMARQHNVVRVARDAARVGAATYEGPEDTVGSLTVPAATAHASTMLTNLNMPCDAGQCTVTARHDVPPTTPVEVIVVTVTYDFEPLFGFWQQEATLQSEFIHAVEHQ